MNRHRPLLPAILSIVFATATHAQDTRTVKEPTIPPVCIKLSATLTRASAISDEVEARAASDGSQNPALDTARIQLALDRCSKGHAVELASSSANDAFVSGPIQLPAGVTLLIDKNVTLFGTRNPEFYALSPGSCGVVNDASTSGCKPLITAKNASGSAIMGDGTIDGQGGAKLIVDGKTTTKTWWDLAEEARASGRQQVPRLIETDLTDDFILYRITLKNSANFHVAFHRGDGFTAWGVKIDTPKTARNTDGIDPAQSTNITITQSFISTGDDNVAIKAGDGPTTHVSVIHNHFYFGHGMSIGSETSGGVSGIRVDDLSLDGPDNGIRIKSNATRGGHVQDVVYNDICIRNSKYPITFDTAYSFPGKGVNQLPVFDDITLRNVRISGGGKLQFNGFDHDHRVGVTLDNVLITDNAATYKPQANHADLTYGPGPVNINFAGDDSTLKGKLSIGKPASCAAKFVPFPR